MPTRTLTETPPNNPEAEQCVLGAVLLEEKKIPAIMEILAGARDFYRTAHREEFARFESLKEAA